MRVVQLTSMLNFSQRIVVSTATPPAPQHLFRSHIYRQPALRSLTTTTITPRSSTSPPTPAPTPSDQQYCRKCGSMMKSLILDGDTRERLSCGSCGFVEYINPKLVVGAIIEHEGQILLCRRGIMPQHGLWTVPAGFLEMGESTAQGAIRETQEEAGANIDIIAPYVHFDIIGIGQAYVLFRGKLRAPYTFEAQLPETLETKLFPMDELPFDELAFSSVAISLRHYVEERKAGTFHYHHGTIVKRPGSGPNEPGSFELVDHISVPTGWGRL